MSELLCVGRRTCPRCAGEGRIRGSVCMRCQGHRTIRDSYRYPLGDSLARFRQQLRKDSEGRV